MTMPALSDAQGLHLGELAPDLATIERIVRDRMEFMGEPLLLFADFCAAIAKLPRLEQITHQNRRDAWSAEDFQEEADTPLTWDENDPRGYRNAVKERAANQQAAWRASERISARGEVTPAGTLLIAVNQRERLTPDFEGWVRYLGLATQAPIEQALRHPRYRRTALFHESGLIDSVLVVAPRGWGKSELLKAIIRHDVQPPNDARPRATVVIIDPGNNLARQVARWPELVGSNRLVYIEPGLRTGLTVGINPLDGTGLDHEGRNEAATMFAEALGANTAPLSMNMETLVIQCATVLMSLPGATLRDLRALLRDPTEDDKAASLYAHARAYPDLEVREFFEHDFLSEGTKGSKVWLAARLQRLFADHHLASMFGGTSSVDLRGAIEARKVVVFNLRPMKSRTTIGIAGRLLTAAIGGIIRARDPDAEYVAPIQFVIDEVTMVAGSALAGMLAELRKYGLNMVMGQQVMGAGMPPEDKATILNNTGGRFIGGPDRGLIRDMLGLGRDNEPLPAINHFQFWTVWQGHGPNLLNVRDDLVGHKLAASPEEWADYVDKATDRLSGFYRPNKPKLEDVADRPPAKSAGATSQPFLEVGGTTPTDVGTLEPGKVAPVKAVKIGLARPPRRNAAKPVDLLADVGAVRQKSRKKPASKPLVDAEKPPEVRKSPRKLD